MKTMMSKKEYADIMMSGDFQRFLAKSEDAMKRLLEEEYYNEFDS